MDAVFFYLSGIVSLVAAVFVVTRRNPVFSAIWLVGFFATMSLDFLILRAPFLAVIQVLVYAGAIMVLFLFVIMLLNLKPEEIAESVSLPRKVGAGVLSAAIFVLLCAAIARSPTVDRAGSLTAPLPAPSPGAAATPLAEAGETAAIGESLFRWHVLAFELSSVLILIAIIAAIYLTKKRRHVPPPPEPVRVEERAGSLFAPLPGDAEPVEAAGARHA